MFDRTMRRRTRRVVALMAFVLTGAMFGAVALNAVAAGDSIEVRDLERRIAAEQQRSVDLEVEHAQLTSSDRVLDAAVDAGYEPAEHVITVQPGPSAGTSR